MNFTNVIREHASIRPDHPAIVDAERCITYSELDRLVDGAASNLGKAGISPGDVVGISQLDRSEETIAKGWAKSLI